MWTVWTALRIGTSNVTCPFVACVLRLSEHDSEAKGAVGYAASVAEAGQPVTVLHTAVLPDAIALQ